MKHRKATATNAQLHLRWPFNTLWRLRRSNRLKTVRAVSREREAQQTLREHAALLLTDSRINGGCGVWGDNADKVPEERHNLCLILMDR